MQSAPGSGRLERIQHKHKFGKVAIPADKLQPWPCPDQDCDYCRDHFRHMDQQTTYLCMFYDRNVGDKEAADTVASLASRAQAHRTKLQNLISDHGDVFMTRWKKRSKDKRLGILQKANPHLPEHRHIAEFERTQANGGKHDDYRTMRNPKIRTASMLPYLATEPLRDNAALLFALIHHRVTFTLEQWAPFDVQQVHDTWEDGELAVEFNSNCVVVYGPRYGHLTRFDADATHRGDMVGYPRGRILLEAQATLMEFLALTVELTLEGANLETASSTRWAAMCREGFRPVGDLAQWSTYNQQPFSPPPVFDVDALIDTVQSRLDYEADHIVLLQTDPAYMRRYIRLLFQGEVYRTVSRTSQFKSVDFHISMELRSLYWWICVKEEAQHVKLLQHRYQGQIGPGSPLPLEYDRALSALEAVLVSFMTKRVDPCRTQLEQRPGFSDYSRFSENGPAKVTKVIINYEPLPNRFFTDPLYWCLMNLCAEPDQEGAIDHAKLFTYLETHLASASPEERARLDQTIRDNFSVLAVNHQLLLNVRLARPHHRSADVPELSKTEDRRVWRDGVSKAGRIAGSASRSALLQRFYETPPPQGRQDASWIEQYHKMSNTLSGYWSSMRAAAHDLQDSEVAHFVRADLEPSHIAQVAAQRQAVLDKIASRVVPPTTVEHIQLPQEPDRPRFEMPRTTVKSKTRPDKQENAAADDPLASKVEEMSVHEQEPAGTMQTSKRALEVFKKMFAADVEEAAQGCEWDAFVHAMRDLGFTARNSAGSAVGFEMPESGRIVFHRPHPTPKIDPIMLRAMGKRLHKWFGFGMESFVLGA